MLPESSNLDYANATLTTLPADKLVFTAHLQPLGTQIPSDVSVPMQIKTGTVELVSLAVAANPSVPPQTSANV